MSKPPGRMAMFEGLVFNEVGEPAEVDWVGDTPCYVVVDAGFHRYVESDAIDRQVLEWLGSQIQSNQELVTESTMRLLGQEDLFTKAMIDASLEQMDEQFERLLQQGLPEALRAWLGLLGLRVVVNVHGDVLRVDVPQATDVDDI